MRLQFWSVLVSAALLSGVAVADENAAASEVRLQAVIAQGAKPISDPVGWIVTKLADKSGVPGEVIATKTAAAPTLQLSPGRYVVAAKYGDTEVRDEIAVAPGKSNHVIDLNAGFIRLDMIPHAGAPAVTKDVTWEIYRYAKGAGVDESRKVTAVVAPSRRFTLPEGYYTVRARHDGTVSDMVLNVVAGHQLSYTLNLYAGRVGLSAVVDKGTVNGDVTWEIVRASTGTESERQVIATHVGKTPVLLLREGRYIVLARSGELVGQAPLEIKAGNMQKVRVKLSQQKAKVTVTDASNG